MAEYTPQYFPNPNGLDERGLRFSLHRLPGETLDAFRQRLLAEARQPAGASEHQYLHSLSRQVGKNYDKMWEIDVVRDANGEPLAADPYIEITSTYIRFYDDYANGSIELEGSILDLNDLYFASDLETAIGTLTYFSATNYYVGDQSHRRCFRFRRDNTQRVQFTELLRETRSNKLTYDMIRSFNGQDSILFQREVADVASVTEEGDWYLDYTNGVLFTYEIGTSFVTYEYSEFPFSVYWEPVSAFPVNDPDIDWYIKDTIIDDETGLEVPAKLNGRGAQIYNRIYEKHPLGWGH